MGGKIDVASPFPYSFFRCDLLYICFYSMVVISLALCTISSETDVEVLFPYLFIRINRGHSQATGNIITIYNKG